MRVRIAGVGFEHNLEVPDDATLQVAINEAGLGDSNLQARVGGEAVSPADYALTDGETVVLSPPDVKLG